MKHNNDLDIPIQLSKNYNTTLYFLYYFSLGERQPVEGSEYDLRLPTCLSDVVDKIPTGRGFENYFCLEDNKDLKLAAR